MEGFNRRDFLKATTGALSALALPLTSRPALSSRRRARAEEKPMQLAPGVHLFLDDFLIAAQNNLRRVINPPARLPHPLVTGREDGNFQPYVTVLRDPQTKRFRMWYGIAVDAGQSHLGHIESEDGIHWIRPHRVLDDPAKITFGASVLDDGPDFPDPARRYKFAWWTGGLWIAFSPDGLHWTAAAPRPVLEGISDIVSLARDPIRNRYLITCKVDSTPEDGYKGRTPNAPEGYRRCVGQSVSKDCVTWEPARRIIKPDEKDEGITEFYSIGGVLARGGLLIGLLKVLRDDLPHEPGAEPHGIGYTVLAWSRDGQTWQRDRQPFLERNPQPGTWDRAMTWGDYQLPVGDEIFIYYGGYARGHKVERFTERQIGLARMKRDRYVSRDAGTEGGWLRTPIVRLDGARLTVNADARGELRIAALDAAGRPLAGFEAKDCAPIRGDSLAHAARWKRPLAALRGRPVQLEFRLRDARLYGFALEEQP
jgi:hypothetical protein